VKFQNVYQGNIDYEKSYEHLCWLFPSVEIMPKGSIRFPIGRDVQVLVSPKGTVQVAWTDEREKIEGLKILQGALVPVAGEKEVVLKPLSQNVSDIPYPEPKDFKLIWCEEGTQYLSFDHYSQLVKDVDEMTQDYASRLDFDAAQRKADLLYSSDVLPLSWKKQLEPLFKDATFKKAWKPQWVRLFLTEMKKLMWRNSK